MAAAEYLPDLEQGPELPEELRRPKSVVAPAYIDQRTSKSFAPDEPKDYAIRMAAGSTPLPRNEDGTITGGYVPEAFGGPRHARVPRTEAQDRAALKKVATDIAAETAPAAAEQSFEASDTAGVAPEGAEAASAAQDGANGKP